MSHAILASKRIPHVVIGGIAVNAHGFAYSTAAVDYLTGDAILDPAASRSVKVFAAGIPWQVQTVTGVPGGARGGCSASGALAATAGASATATQRTTLLGAPSCVRM